MKKFKKIQDFLLKFFITYFTLFAIYSLYLLNFQKKAPFTCAPITRIVADQTVDVLDVFGIDADAYQHEDEMSVKLLVNNQFTARVIEGCNSISLIILFVSFVIAFPGNFLYSVIFSIIGSILIYLVNIFRIAFLTVMLHKFPNNQEILHNIVFPAIIYSAIFGLWVLWVKKYSMYKDE